MGAFVFSCLIPLERELLPEPKKVWAKLHDRSFLSNIYETKSRRALRRGASRPAILHTVFKAWGGGEGRGGEGRGEEGEERGGEG